MNIYVVNESSLVTDKEAWNIAWALNWQAQYQFGRSGWRSDIYVGFMPKTATPPKDSALLHLLDTSDQPGALGYHDQDGNEVPYARVFAKTAQDDGDAVSEVASHELLELAVDPLVNDSCLTGNQTRLFAKEVGDPCQGNGYQIAGITVADFVLPNYFDPETSLDAKTDFRGALKGPFVVGSQGYVSYIDTSNFAAGWQQQIGSARTKPVTPDRDDRLVRRGILS